MSGKKKIYQSVWVVSALEANGQQLCRKDCSSNKWTAMCYNHSLHHCSVTRMPEWHFQVIHTKDAIIRWHKVGEGSSQVEVKSGNFGQGRRSSLLTRLRPFANNLIWSHFTSKLVTFASHFHCERNGERSLAILDCCCCCCLFLKVNRAISKEYFLLLFTAS